MSWNTRTHGMSDTPTYQSWATMKQRCSNEKDPQFTNYGARGIVYDDKWETFEGFISEMGICPKGLTLDRVDVNSNYSAENCRWADRTTQSHVRRKMVYTVSTHPSQFIGVSYRKGSGRWRAKLMKKGVVYIDRSYASEVEAAIAYDTASLLHFGDEPNKLKLLKLEENK